MIKRRLWRDEMVLACQMLDAGGNSLLFVGREQGQDGKDIKVSCTALIDKAKHLSI